MMNKYLAVALLAAIAAYTMYGQTTMPSNDATF